MGPFTAEVLAKKLRAIADGVSMGQGELPLPEQSEETLRYAADVVEKTEVIRQAVSSAVSGPMGLVGAVDALGLRHPVDD